MKLGALLPIVALAGSMTGAAPDAAAEGYIVIVNADREGDAVTREVLLNIFLQKVRRWGDGTDTVAVDQSMKSQVREAFSREALGMSTAAVMAHWQHELLAGHGRPPRVKETDAEVVEFVGSTPGAIGYVSAGTNLTPAVKELKVLAE